MKLSDFEPAVLAAVHNAPWIDPAKQAFNIQLALDALFQDGYIGRHASRRDATRALKRAHACWATPETPQEGGHTPPYHRREMRLYSKQAKEKSND